MTRSGIRQPVLVDAQPPLFDDVIGYARERLCDGEISSGLSAARRRVAARGGRSRVNACSAATHPGNDQGGSLSGRLGIGENSMDSESSKIPLDESRPPPQSEIDEARADERYFRDVNLAELKAKLTRLQGRRRLIPLVFVGALVLVSIAAGAFGSSAPRSLDPLGLIGWSFELSHDPRFATALGLLVLAAVVALTRVKLDENGIQAEIELEEAKKRIATRLPASDDAAPTQNQPASYFDSLVKINIDNLAEYYSLVKVHTNNSFKASLIAAFAGFAFILIGVGAGFWGKEATTPAALAAISGIIIEFISGVFFYLYNKTVRQLKEYHDSLLSVQNVLLSLKLVSDTEDASARRDMTSRTCEVLLAGVNLPVREEKKTVKPKKSSGRSAMNARPAASEPASS
jgi:hypothetical protein